MKNYKYKILVLFLILGIVACDREEFDNLASAEYKYVGMVSQKITNDIFEGTGTVTTTAIIPMYYDLGNMSSDVEVTFTVSGTAQLGTDFMIPEASSTNGQTFTISLPIDTTATFFSIVTVTNDVQNDNKPFTLSISDTPEGVFAGAPVSSSEGFVIIDDDCPYDFDRFVGTANVEEIGCCIYTLSAVEIAPNTIQINNFWDSGIQAYLVLAPCGGTVSIPQQSTPAFGDPDGNIVGSGTWDDQTGVIDFNVTISFPAFGFVSQENHIYTFP